MVVHLVLVPNYSFDNAPAFRNDFISTNAIRLNMMEKAYSTWLYIRH